MRRFHVASILQCSVGLSASFKVLWSDSVRHRTSLETLIVLSFWGNSGMISKNGTNKTHFWHAQISTCSLGRLVDDNGILQHLKMYFLFRIIGFQLPLFINLRLWIFWCVRIIMEIWMSLRKEISLQKKKVSFGRGTFYSGVKKAIPTP